MKFKERIGNVFVFDGGYDSEELDLVQDDEFGFFAFKFVVITPDFSVSTYMGRMAPYKDIQTAVNLMTILKDEGLV